MSVIRPQRNATNHSRSYRSTYRTDKKDWIYIPVPAIVDEDLFVIAEEQLEENKRKARVGERGATHLLQGLVVCNRCGHAYCGTGLQVFLSKKTGKTCSRAYYRCCGVHLYYLDGSKHCNNKSIRIEVLDTAVWEKV
jgi:site-specific DNA recombinase